MDDLEKRLSEAKTTDDAWMVLLDASIEVFKRKLKTWEIRHLRRLWKVYSVEDIFDAIMISGDRIKTDSFAYTSAILRNWKEDGMTIGGKSPNSRGKSPKGRVKTTQR